MRYLVIQMSSVPPDPDDPSFSFPDVHPPVLCRDVEEVWNAVRKAEDWSVFELIEGKFVQRSVVFQQGGGIRSIQLWNKLLA